jgi:hypothetical protein
MTRAIKAKVGPLLGTEHSRKPAHGRCFRRYMIGHGEYSKVSRLLTQENRKTLSIQAMWIAVAGAGSRFSSVSLVAEC